MHILITGGTGFIGSKITNRLLMNGHKISAIIRPTSSTFNININHVNKLNLSFFYPDKLSSIFVAALPIDWVIHAATDYGYDRQKLENVHLSNVELPKNLLELCSKNKVNGFINLDTFFNSDKYQYRCKSEENYCGKSYKSKY
jgi:nucleoside-diphosphate-sugar epimerase